MRTIKHLSILAIACTSISCGPRNLKPGVFELNDAKSFLPLKPKDLTSTAEFDPDGTVRVSGFFSEGTWKQSGDKLIIHVEEPSSIIRMMQGLGWEGQGAIDITWTISSADELVWAPPASMDGLKYVYTRN